MERKSSKMGMNRTGTKTSPILCKEATQGAEDAAPSSPGDASGIWKVRAEYCQEAEGLGSMPPPTSLKGVAKAAMTALKGERATVFLDKLGARAGFERTGVRLYEAALSKLDVYGTWDGGPSREQLERIRGQELAHYALVKESIEQLGGDPTALTPMANLQANISMGVPRVLTDPKVNLHQCLDALLVAELTDNANWEMLVDLARELGQDDLVRKFQQALEVEQEHLLLVRRWLTAATRLELTVGEEAAGAPAS
jgi:rubrerythrin